MSDGSSEFAFESGCSHAAGSEFLYVVSVFAGSCEACSFHVVGFDEGDAVACAEAG